MICVDDNMAVALFGVARERKLQIPRDLSVVGMEDLPLAAALNPGLTTVRLPAYELGAAGMAAMFEAFAGRAMPAQVLPVSLTVRRSTAAPR